MSSSPSRLYYTDAYLTTFDAVVQDVLDVGGQPAVTLDVSAFYPTSGGQPFDIGTLGEARVLEVVDLDDGRVAHVLDRELSTGTHVHGVVDWTRRFDHMQQHTGQHALSAAFDRVCHARTESFHLGTDTSTIDLGIAVTAEQVAAAEDEANRIVWEDRPVTVRFASADEARQLPLRKESLREGTLRLVDIEGFDLSACGGTHVARSGGIGIIAVLGTERFKGGTRVEFVCGGRVLRRFRQQRDILAAGIKQLSVLPAELPAAIERLQSENKAQRTIARTLQSQLVAHEARALTEAAESVAGRRLVVRRMEGFDAQGLKALAIAIAATPGCVACLLSADERPLVVIARSADVPLDCAAVLRGLIERLGGKGGGRPELAQGTLTGAADLILPAARALLERG
jgi:alanyl-tRNA synthetase